MLEWVFIIVLAIFLLFVVAFGHINAFIKRLVRVSAENSPYAYSPEFREWPRSKHAEDDSEDYEDVDLEGAEPQSSEFESYETFENRHRQEAWASSAFAKDYANYEDYAARNKPYRGRGKAHTRRRKQSHTRSRTRSYAHAKTQSVPHTPRIAALRELGLSGSPSQKAIKSAYRKLARKHHPDNFMTKGDAAVEAAETKMKALNTAYDYLSGS